MRAFAVGAGPGKAGRALLCGLLAAAAAPLAAQMPPMPPEKVVELFGQRVRYHDAGQGPAVILLHGLGGHAGNWAATLPAVSAKYHAYALDQIGFGRSDKPAIEYRVQTFVDFLVAFMDSLRIPKATLVGNSLGGWIATDFAAQYPARVEKLVLVDAAGMRPTGPAAAVPDLNPASLAATRKVLELVFHEKTRVTDEVVQAEFERRLRSGDGYTIQRTAAGFAVQDQWIDAKAASLHVPTLLVWGRNDALIPLAVGEAYRKAIFGSRLVVFDGCGHVPQLERPLDFNRTLLEFLAKP